MADAWVYMFVVGSGAASGVAATGLITYVLFKKMNKPKNKKKRGVV